MGTTLQGKRRNSSACLILTLATTAWLAACGVKGPPAGIRRDKTPPPMLDCSPYDKKCDRLDPNYVPGLDPNNPNDAKKIKALEEAARQRDKNRSQQ